MRHRTYTSDFLEDEVLALLSDELERTLIRLRCHCDDEGRAKADPRLIASAVFPFGNVSAEAVEHRLIQLAVAGVLLLYMVDGTRYLAIQPTFWRQKPNRPIDSKLPAPTPDSVLPHELLTEDSRSSHERLTPEGEGVGVVDQEDVPTDHPFRAATTPVNDGRLFVQPLTEEQQAELDESAAWIKAGGS